MKHYYRIWDAIIQIILFSMWAYAMVTSAGWLTVLQFIAGGWYIASLALHNIISSNKFQAAYRNYALICIALIALPLYGFILIYVLIAEMYLLPFLLPVLALTYTYSCIAEIIYLRKRPISYLK